MQRFQRRYPRAAKAIRYTSNAIQIAQKAYSMATTIASIVNSEKKHFDASATVNPSAAVPTVTHLTAVTQGDTDQSRHGDSIAIKSLKLNLDSGFASNATVFDKVRFVLVRDNDNEAGTAPTALQVFGSATPEIARMRNMEYPKRFSILMDRVYNVNTSKYSWYTEYFKKFKMLKDMKGNPTRARHITWTSGNDEARGHIYLFCISNTAANHPTINVVSRIRFYDN